MDHKQREIESIRRELEVFKGPRKNPVMCNYSGTASLNVVKICNKRFTNEIKGLLFTIWRLRYQLINEQKFKLRDEATNEIKGALARPEESIYGKGGAKKREVRYDFDEDHGISVASSLADGVLRALKNMRDKANAILFELFTRSQSNADHKKS